jgi:hypothetical protein
LTKEVAILQHPWLFLLLGSDMEEELKQEKEEEEEESSVGLSF